MMMRRIIAVPVHAEAVRSEFKRFLDQASLENWGELKVRFGFAWNARPDLGDGAEKIMSPADLAETVAAAESQKAGNIGSGDLYVTPTALGVEHLFCHEADIHLEGPEESEYIEAEASRFASLGWTVYDCRKAPGETGYARVTRFTPRS